MHSFHRITSFRLSPFYRQRVVSLYSSYIAILCWLADFLWRALQRFNPLPSRFSSLWPRERSIFSTLYTLLCTFSTCQVPTQSLLICLQNTHAEHCWLTFLSFAFSQCHSYLSNEDEGMGRFSFFEAHWTRLGIRSRGRSWVFSESTLPNVGGVWVLRAFAKEALWAWRIWEWLRSKVREPTR